MIPIYLSLSKIISINLCSTVHGRCMSWVGSSCLTSLRDDNVQLIRERQFARRFMPASSEFDSALLSGIPSIGAA